MENCILKVVLMLVLQQVDGECGSVVMIVVEEANENEKS
jgi:hypothetical protein